MTQRNGLTTGAQMMSRDGEGPARARAALKLTSDATTTTTSSTNSSTAHNKQRHHQPPPPAERSSPAPTTTTELHQVVLALLMGFECLPS
jgi:hypothetical protein